MQEFLAAHYVSNLPPDDELKMLKENFWSDTHLNMFTMYLWLTKGQHPSFKKFFSDGNEAISISEKFLGNQLKCLQLYRYFNEADDHVMCKYRKSRNFQQKNN